MGGIGGRWSLARRVRDARRGATSQFGLLTTEQLEQFAVDSMGRSRMVQRGLLVSVHPGVWRIPDVAPSKRQQWLAACLAVQDAALSHYSAAAFYELDVPDVEAVHVAVPRHGVRGPEGVRVHCVTSLPSRSIARVGPLRVTRIERTLLDLAAFMDEESLQTVFDSAWLKGRVNPVELGRQPRTDGKCGKVASPFCDSEESVRARPTLPQTATDGSPVPSARAVAGSYEERSRRPERRGTWPQRVRHSTNADARSIARRSQHPVSLTHFC